MVLLPSRLSSTSRLQLTHLCPVDPVSVRCRPLGEPFDYVEFELVIFCVEKGAEEPRPPLEDKHRVSQRPALFVTDVLQTNLPRVFYVQELDGLDKPPLTALVQILLKTLNFFSKEHLVCSVADPVNVRVFSLDSSFS